MAISKLCARCQEVIPYTEKICDKCKAVVGSHRKIRDRIYYEARVDKEYQSVYRNNLWKKVRKVALNRANGLCEECVKKGKINYADDVHHIVPIKVNINKAYDINNLICLCRACHIEAHKNIENKLGRGS